MSGRIGVLMLNLGGPARLADVRPFLHNLFSDRDTIRFPGGALGQRLFAFGLSRLRAPAVRRNYAAIGGGTPLICWTELQGRALAEQMRRRFGVEVVAVPCMRYWHPMAEAALRQLVDAGCDRIVAFSQYPQFSDATAGNSLRDVARTAKRCRIEVPRSEIGSFHDHPSYAAAVAECVVAGLEQIPVERRAAARIVYSAHSLPMSLVERGDPYPGHVRGSVAAVQRATGLPQQHEIAWQSKVGPARWLEPSTVDRIRALPAEGVRDALVVPISFTSDHIETLHELDVELAEDAAAAGLEGLWRAPSLNDRAAFAAALADVLAEHLGVAAVTARREVS